MDGNSQRSTTPPEWVDALGYDELGDKPRIVKLDGRQIALFKTENEIFACNNRCPHEGYPLAEGTLSDGCILTCNWHNWKFDLSNGETLVGGDRLRRYPVKIEGDRILVDLADPPISETVNAAIADLLDSFDDHDYDRMAREIARIIKVGGDPLDALHATLSATHDKFEFGMGHAIAAGADWLALRERLKDDEAKQLTCITEVVAHLAWDSRRQRVFAYTVDELPFEPDAFIAAIENEDEDRAIAYVRGALKAGLGYDDLFESLARAALAHYQDFGHSLIYVLKAGEFIQKAGPDALEPVLLMLVRSLVFATREDLIPEFKSYAPALAVFEGGSGTPDLDVLKKSGVAQVLNEIKSHGGDPTTCYNALFHAASWQMLHMDLSYSFATTGPVQDNVGWLDFTHALTFANAVRRTCTLYPDLWPAGLLQIGCFLGRNAKYVDAGQDVSIWHVDDPVLFAGQASENAVDHGQFEYIVAAHILKLSHAVSEELEFQPNADWAGTAAAALNRFLNSPLKRKHPLRSARQALDMVEREG